MTKLLKGFLSRSRISNNTAPKLASLFFAVLLWVYVMDIENPETLRTFKDVPIQLINVEELQDSGLILINNQNYTVDVKVEGRRSDVLNVKKAEIGLTADLIGSGKGNNSVPIESNLSADNVKLAEMSKTEIKIELDRIVTIPKSVEIIVNGDLPIGYEYGSLISSPQEVLVEGPESVVNSVVKLVGEVEISGQTTDLFKQVPIKAVNSEDVVVLKVQPKVEYVNVDVAVKKTKNVNLREAIVGNVQDGYRLVGVSLKPQSVTIRGSEQYVDSVDWLKTQSIDISQMTDKTTQNVDLILPNGIELPYLSVPISATVNIEQIVSKTFSFTLDDINIANLDSDLDINLMDNTPYFEINFTGINSLISKVTKEDVILSLDLANHIQGKYSKSLIVQLSPTFSELENPLKEINIELTEKEIPEEVTEEVIPEEIPEDSEPVEDEI